MDNFLFLPRALAAFAFDLAFASAFGSLLALLWHRFHSQIIVTGLRRVLAASAAVMLLTLPILLWLLTATMIASAAPADIRPQLWDVLTGTHAGRVLIPDFLCAALLLGASPLTRRRPGIYLGLALMLLLSVFRSGSGHAAANGNMSLSEAVQFLHLASIAVWAGGVIVAALFVLPRVPSHDQLTHFGRRLSLAATVAIGLVALTGIYNAWIGLDGSLRPLAHTQWGLILMAKSALVLAALALGAANRLTLGRNPILTSPDAARFLRSMRLEAVVMTAVLALSAFLANSPPATGN